MSKRMQIIISVVIVAILVASLLFYFNPFSSSPTELVDTNTNGEVQKGFIPQGEEIKIGPYIIPSDEDLQMKNASSRINQQLLLYYKRENNPSGYITYGPTDSINLANLAQSQIGSPANYSGDLGPTQKMIELAGKEALLVTIPAVSSEQIRVIIMQLDGDRAFQLAMSGPSDQETAIKTRIQAYADKITKGE